MEQLASRRVVAWLGVAPSQPQSEFWLQLDGDSVRRRFLKRSSATSLFLERIRPLANAKCAFCRYLILEITGRAQVNSLGEATSRLEYVDCTSLLRFVNFLMSLLFRLRRQNIRASV